MMNDPIKDIPLKPQELYVLLAVWLGRNQQVPEHPAYGIPVVFSPSEASSTLRHLMQKKLLHYDGSHGLTALGVERVQCCLEKF